jgi:hypothetical protein
MTKVSLRAVSKGRPQRHNKVYRFRNRRTLNHGSLNLAWLGRNPEGNAASSVGVVLWGVVSQRRQNHKHLAVRGRFAVVRKTRSKNDEANPKFSAQLAMVR